MARPGENDREAVDRAFAEMIASYHLTADRPEPATVEPPSSAAAETAPVPDATWADQHPLFRMVDPEPAPDPAPTVEEAYVPDPLPPLSRPGIPALIGWIGIGYAVLAVLVAAVGVPLPTWAGWLAVGSFICGFGILLTQLPRNRPPDAGDGAVL
ncbi:MAG TPA: hypothetical protein VIT20_01065 [Propionibacteriaceae bacterium]